MARVRKRRRRSRDEIDSLLERFDRSGLTQIAFARRERLSVSTLRSWLTRRRRQHAAAPRFVPVAVADGAVEYGPALELELGSGRRIHIPVDIDRDGLRTLLPIVVAAC